MLLFSSRATSKLFVLPMLMLMLMGCPDDEPNKDVKGASNVPSAGGSAAATSEPGSAAAAGLAPPSAPDPSQSGPFTAPTSNLGTFDGEVASAATVLTPAGFAIPIFLYKGGVTPTNYDGLVPTPAGAVKHRADNPDLWTEWRRTPAGVERKINKNWELVDDEYAPLAMGTTVSSTFLAAHRTFGQRKYRLSADHTFKYCDYLRVAGNQKSETFSGTYEIDGFVVRLHHADGSTDLYSFVYDPTARPNTMWIDREAFMRANTETESTPLTCR
jgi:hypothetical protein